MTNNLYEFLKPTLPKLALTILFIYLLVPIMAYPIIPLPTQEIGYLTFLECNDQMSNCLEDIISKHVMINNVNLLLGIIVGYLFSCVLVKTGSWILTKIPYK